MTMATACSRVIDLSGRVPTEAYGLVARVFMDLPPGDGIQLVAERDLDQLVSTFRLCWGEEFGVERAEAGPERWTYDVTRRAGVTTHSLS